MEQKIIAPENKMARLFKISERKVRDLFKDAKEAPGKYNLLRSIEIYTEYTAGADEKNNLARVNREIQEIKLKQLQDEFYEKEELERELGDMLVRFRSRLLEIPKQLRGEFKNKNEDEIEKILKKYIIKTLEELKKLGEKFEGSND